METYNVEFKIQPKLPYIFIPSLKAKFLLDTGSTVNVIKPSIAKEYFPDKISHYNTSVVSFNNSTKLTEQVTIPLLYDFNLKANMSCLLHDFHPFFDGIIGVPLIEKFQFKIDLTNKILSNDYYQIPILNYTPSQNKPTIFQTSISPKSTKMVIIPTQLQDGQYLIEKGQISKTCNIDEILTTVENKSIKIQLTNPTLEIFEAIINVNELEEKKIRPLNDYLLSEEINFHADQSYDLDLSKIRLDHLNYEEKCQLLKILDKNKNALFNPSGPLHFTNEIKHEIKTTDEIPVHAKNYRFPFIHKQEVRRQINEMLDKNIIRESFSPWSSPIWIVPKKIDASNVPKWRLVIDYRNLNQKSIDQVFPIPNITDLLDKLGKCNYFSTLDLASGFHQIQVHPNSIEKTAFSTEDGHFEFLRMPFGLKNAPSTFQRMINHVLRDFINKICLVYMDDVIVFSTSLEEHMINLDKILKKLDEKGLKIQLDKSEFLHKEVLFLGHRITTKGIEPNHDKVIAIQNYPIPNTAKEIKSFLGLAGFYRKFIQNFAKITKPLTACLKKNAKIEHSKDFINSVEKIKEILTNKPILQYPDFTKKFIVTTDASKFAIGAVLSQKNEKGHDLPISYISRTLNKSEINYSTIEKELLGIVWACKMFRPYLYGTKFQLKTDQKPLSWLWNLKEPQSKLVRWRLKLEEYDYEIEYIKGKSNLVADALSRIPKNECNINETVNDVSSNAATIGSLDSSPIEPLEEVRLPNKSTVHSNSETTLEIPISEKPINQFSHQIHIDMHPSKMEFRTQKVFNKQILTWKINEQENLNEQFSQLTREFIKPKVKYAIFFIDNILTKLFTKFIQTNLSKPLEFVICNTKLINVTNPLQQKEILRKFHENSNHKGIQENVKEIEKKYYWPNLQNHVNKFINECQTCLEAKNERRPINRLPILHNPLGQHPFDHLYIDTITLDSVIYLTIIDSFSRYGQAMLIESKNPIDVKFCLLEYFTQHNVPNSITSDNGKEFNNELIKEFSTSLNIEWHFNIPNRPQGRALIERFHSTLLENIRVLKSKNPNQKIKEIVLKSIIYYNNSVHSKVKQKPFVITHGYESDIMTRIPDLKEINEENKIEEHLNQIKIIQNVVLNQHSNEEECTPVSLNSKTTYLKRPSKKTQPQFKPLDITKQKSKLVYSDHNKFHEEQLKVRKNFVTEDENDSHPGVPLDPDPDENGTDTNTG